MDGEYSRFVKELAHYGIASKTAVPTHDDYVYSYFMAPGGPMLMPLDALGMAHTYYTASWQRAQFDTRLAPTPRSDQDRGFPRTHEHGLRMADVLREVPHG